MALSGFLSCMYIVVGPPWETLLSKSSSLEKVITTRTSSTIEYRSVSCFSNLFQKQNTGLTIESLSEILKEDLALEI